MGYDPEIYHRIPDTPKDIDICFIGRLYDNRKDLIERMIHDFPDLKIKIWGRYVRYREIGTWIDWLRNQIRPERRGIFINKNITAKHTNIAYNRSKIVINIHHNQSKYGCNPRSFEICGSGSLQVVNSNFFLEQEMAGGFISFSNYDDLKKIITQVISDTNLMNTVSAIGAEHVKRHSFKNRVTEMLKYCGE